MESEIWKDVIGYEGVYQVSDLGQIKSMSRLYEWRGTKRMLKGRVLKGGFDRGGYRVVSLHVNREKKTRTVHQLVAEAFLNYTQNGYNLVVNHKDFNRSNNRLNNLEVVTFRENANKKHLPSSSQYTGVCWAESKNKWKTQIHINGKQMHVGYFDNEYDAYLAYEKVLKDKYFKN